jgi:hypothetical protein
LEEKALHSVLQNYLLKLGGKKRLGRTQRFQLRIKAYKNIVVKTLKFLVKCTDTFLFWQKMPVLENRRKVVQHQARKYGKLNLGWNVSLMDSWI